ncbi:MAG: hypothetical protein FJ076_06900, partial [Cyanobacteria bacterium K_DeepCast_35m_m1_288]|nr:hypothetical protein [Cyanobacteria bacterium K_DeepCast_35m_m1_288]
MGKSPEFQWHAFSPEACLEQLKASRDGLTTAETARRLAASGPNKLELSEGRSAWQILWDQ